MDASAADSAAWTVARLLSWTQDYFRQHRLESPRLCAELLLASALGCERIQLYTRFDQTPDRDGLTRFRDLVRRAAGGAPIAYLTGFKEFFALSFRVTADVLIPRPETEVLVERVIDLVRKDASLVRLLDLCTGSGCIAIALARNLPGAQLFASDISDAALRVARENAARLGVAEKLQFAQGDLFEPWRSAAEFDLVTANAPYIASGEIATLPANVRDFEPRLALLAGDDGLALIRRIVAAAPERLRCGGWLFLEVAFDQAARVAELFERHRWETPLTFRDDLGHWRVVAARRSA